MEFYIKVSIRVGWLEGPLSRAPGAEAEGTNRRKETGEPQRVKKDWSQHLRL